MDDYIIEQKEDYENYNLAIDCYYNKLIKKIEINDKQKEKLKEFFNSVEERFESGEEEEENEGIKDIGASLYSNWPYYLITWNNEEIEMFYTERNEFLNIISDE